MYVCMYVHIYVCSLHEYIYVCVCRSYEYICMHVNGVNKYQYTQKSTITYSTVQ